MASTDPTAVIILAELIVFETIALIGIISYLIAKKRKRAKTLAGIIESLKQTRPEQAEKLSDKLHTIPYLTKEKADIASKEITDSKHELHELVITAFHDNNTIALNDLGNAIEKLATGYETLLPDENTGDVPPAAQKIAQQENASLVPDVDKAIDELLADDGPPIVANPDFDLSETEVQDEMCNDENEIAEIPDELLASEATPDQPLMDDIDDQTVATTDNTTDPALPLQAGDTTKAE